MSLPTQPKKRRGRKAAAVLAVLAPMALAIFAMTWGTTYLWPDYVHTDYGFPLTWGTHQTNSIAGPVDRWMVNLSSFTLDMLIWFGLVAVAVAAVELFWER